MREQSSAIACICKEIEPLLPLIRGQLYELEVHADYNQLELRFRSKPTDLRLGLMLRVVVSDEDRLIAVPNILKPQIIGQRGVGRSLIAAMRTTANRIGYRLYIVDLVPGFYRKLISWGGRHIDDETVEITETTRLGDVMPGQSTFNELDGSYLSDEQREAGYERFVAEHPEVVSEIEAMGPNVAKTLGIDYQKCRKNAIVQALEGYANAGGIDSFEYLLRYAVEPASEREGILQRRHAAINTILGK